jgi:hypothetical protein
VSLLAADVLYVLQKMRRLHCILLAFAALSIAGCDRGDKGSDSFTPSPDSHREIIAKFQDGQERFKGLIATVRDEKSFDAAKPELHKIVSDWREVAASLGELQPPSEEQQAEFRALIAEGHRATEPTGEDMLSLISIESREAEVTRWLEEFAAAGGAVGTEMVRLYGPTDYNKGGNDTPKIEAKFIQVGGGTEELSFDWIESASTIESTEAEQAGAGQPATRPQSNSEGSDKLQPEAEGRSR